MNQPLKHHYLPVFYLRRWVGEDGRLVRYHRPPGRPDGKVVTSRVSPDYTGFGEQLYTLHGASAPQMIETDFFSPVDNAAAPILDHLIAHGPASLDKTQRWYLARFVHSLQLRGPHSLTEINAFVERNLRENIERLDGPAYLATKQEGDPDSVFDDLLEHSPDEIANTGKMFLPGLIEHEFIIQLIINMRWEVMDLSAATCTLLTADRPYTTSHGFCDHSCVLTVPLSPIHLFTAANDIGQLQKIAAQKADDTVRDANKLMTELAVQNVYGSTDSHLEFIEQRLRRHTEPPVPGLITRD